MREIEVSFEYDGFVSGIDGQENTFNVTFSYSPSPALVYWSDIMNKPTPENPEPFDPVAFSGVDSLTNLEIEQIMNN